MVGVGYCTWDDGDRLAVALIALIGSVRSALLSRQMSTTMSMWFWATGNKHDDAFGGLEQAVTHVVGLPDL